MQEFDPRHFMFQRNSGIPRGELHADTHYSRRQRLRLVVIGAVGVTLFFLLFAVTLWVG